MKNIEIFYPWNWEKKNCKISYRGTSDHHLPAELGRWKGIPLYFRMQRNNTVRNNFIDKNQMCVNFCTWWQHVIWNNCPPWVSTYTHSFHIYYPNNYYIMYIFIFLYLRPNLKCPICPCVPYVLVLRE